MPFSATASRLRIEHAFAYPDRMTTIELLRVELEQQRRALAMLPPQAPLTRETAIALIERCQSVLEAARRIG